MKVIFIDWGVSVFFNSLEYRGLVDIKFILLLLCFMFIL